MIDYNGFGVKIEPMQVQDIGDVLHIERVSFSAPWTARAYEYELRYNDMAHYYVARINPDRFKNTRNNGRGITDWCKRLIGGSNGPSPEIVVGYVGFWLMAGEAHISTIAVKPEYRGHSFGELLLATAIQEAQRSGAHVATLEVRVSNTGAQELYLKYGFEKVGMRKAYYSDNNEDAFIMTTPTLGSAAYQQKFQRLQHALALRFQEGERATPGRRA